MADPYTQRVLPEVAASQPRLQDVPRFSYDLGGEIGRGVSAITTGLRAQQVVREENARIWSAQAISKAQIDANDFANQAKLSANEGGAGYREGADKWWGDYSSKLVENAPTPEAKKYIGLRAAQLGSRLTIESANWEAAQGQLHRESQLADTANNSVNFARQNPNLAFEAISNLRATLLGAGLQPHAREAMVVKSTQDIAYGASLTLAERDPKGWLEKVQNGQDDLAALMDPQQAQQLIGHAQALSKQLESKGIATANHEIRVAEAAVKNGDEYKIGDPAKRADELGLTDEHRDAYIEQATALQLASSALKNLPNATPEQVSGILNDIDSHDPKDPAYLAKQQALGYAHTIVNDRNEKLNGSRDGTKGGDPAQYAIDNNVNDPGTSHSVGGLWEALTSGRSETPEEHQKILDAYMIGQESYQRAVGVRQVKYFPESYVKDLVSRMTDPNHSEKAADVIAQAKATFGGYYDGLYRQLKDDPRLQGAYRVIPDVSQQTGYQIEEMIKTDPKKLAGGLKVTDIEDGLSSDARGYIEAINREPGGVNAGQDVRNTIVGLAEFYMQNDHSLSAKKAAQKAYEAVSENYNVSDKLRVPKFDSAGSALDADQMQSGAQHVLESVAPEDFAVRQSTVINNTDDKRSEFASDVKSGGYWVAASNNKGALLYYQGAPVLGKDGNVIFQNWNDLKTADTSDVAPKVYGPRLGLIGGRAEPAAGETPSSGTLSRKPIPIGSQAEPAASTPGTSPRAGRELGRHSIPTRSQTASTLSLQDRSQWAVVHNVHQRPLDGSILSSLHKAERKKLAYDSGPVTHEILLRERRDSIPQGLLLAVIQHGEQTESWEVNKHSKAAGMTQLIPSNIDVNNPKSMQIPDPADPVAAIEGGAIALKDGLYRYKGDVQAAVAYYLGGKPLGDKIEHGDDLPNKSDDAYLRRVMGAFAQYNSMLGLGKGVPYLPSQRRLAANKQKPPKRGFFTNLFEYPTSAAEE